MRCDDHWLIVVMIIATIIFDAYHKNCDDHGQGTCESPAKCIVHFLAESIGNCRFRLGGDN